MGVCVSSDVRVSEEEKALHREAERQMREAKVRLDSQVKVRPSCAIFLVVELSVLISVSLRRFFC